MYVSNSSKEATGDENASMNIQIGMNVAKVQIERSWFDPGVFQLTKDMFSFAGVQIAPSAETPFIGSDDAAVKERFKKMTEAYEAEQATLTERVKVLRRELATAKEETEGVDKFLRIVRKYTEIAELTPETVREFIDRIIVHEAEKTDGKKRQIVEIYYNCVGVIPNPA